jgi:two-component system OmpR family sensor kinase
MTGPEGVQILTSVRFRLTIWYLLIFGSLLVLFSSFIYGSIARELQTRLDRALSDSVETVASVMKGEVNESQGDIAAGASEALGEVRLPNAHISVILDGNVVAADSPDWREVSVPADVAPSLSEGKAVLTTLKDVRPDGARLAFLNVEVGGKVCTLVAAHPLGDVAEQLASIRRMFYLALPAALLVAGLGGFLMAKKSLAPVVAMSDQAELIGATNLHERLHVANRTDELGRLAGVFNDLLSRLDGSFKSMRQFMADASHELRTPLAIVRGEADIALSQDRDAAQYREALEIIQDEAGRLSRIVEDMLELARADAGQRPLSMSRFYINDVVEECCRSMHVLSAAKGVSLAMTPSSDTAITADEDLIRRMIMNLLDNAIKYTPAGGSVNCAISVRAGQVSVSITDTGIGVPAEVASHVFHRFYRGDQARTEHPLGTGLGLAIARWIAESHGGSIAVDTPGGPGSTFTISLPAQS